jgi:hypothetical protein
MQAAGKKLIYMVLFSEMAGPIILLYISEGAKGLDMKGDSELGLALGVGALCKAAIGQLL